MKVPNLTIIVLLLCLNGCNKDDNTPEIEKDPGTFIAFINQQEWNPQLHRAYYNPQRHQLFIEASDNTSYSFTIGISMDSLNPLKTYLLESNGNNVAKLETSIEQFTSDHNVADAGGSFTLTKLDLINKTLSGNLAFSAYSSHRDDKLTFSSGIITDISLHIDTSSYEGNYVSCDVVGAKSTSWLSKDIYASLYCHSVTDTLLDFRISSILGYSPRNRSLVLRIPMNTIPGVYTIYPDKLPYSECPAKNIIGIYNVNNIDNRYHAISGSLAISSADWHLKKLNATFTVTVEDTLRQEMIQIKDGVISLNKWEIY